MRMCGSGRRNGLPGRTKKLRAEKWIGHLRHPLDKIRPIQARVALGPQPRGSFVGSNTRILEPTYPSGEPWHECELRHHRLLIAVADHVAGCNAGWSAAMSC